MKAEIEKIREAMLLAKAAAEQFEKLDPARTEIEVAFACLGRARRLLLERPVEA